MSHHLAWMYAVMATAACFVQAEVPKVQSGTTLPCTFFESFGLNPIAVRKIFLDTAIVAEGPASYLVARINA